jgi:hypothetical protein
MPVELDAERLLLCRDAAALIATPYLADVLITGVLLATEHQLPRC